MLGALFATSVLVTFSLDHTALGQSPSGIIVPGSAAAGSGASASQGHTLVARVEPGDAALPLHGSAIAGELYISLEPATGIDRVTFYLDDPQLTKKAFRTENNPPFDFNGGTATVPNDWNTASKPDGSHVITAVLRFVGGTSATIHATFTISNAVPPVPPGSGGDGGGGGDDGSVGSLGHTLRTRSAVSAPSIALHDQTVTGEIFVTLEPTGGIDEVAFWLDDPDQSGEPRRVEGNPPFDFDGGSATVPNGWDTAEIPDGGHEITAEIRFLDGSVESIRAIFTVANTVPSVVSDNTSAAFTFAAGVTGSASATAHLSLSSGGSAPFTLQTPNVGWLSVTASSSMLPATLSLSVNSGGLAAGVHEATITASSAGYASAQISVTMTITSVTTPPPPPPEVLALSFGDELVRHDFFLDSPGADASTVSLAATNGASVPFTLSFSPQSWFAVSTSAGVTPAPIVITVSSIGLAAGVYETDIVASSPGYVSATTTVRVTIASGSATLASSITQEGFTWNFAGEAEVGQFVNGDYYVIGPVTLTSVSPSWNGTYDGSMINPTYGDDHGYDARWNFESSLRANTNNRVLLPGQSLVSVDSWRDGEAGAPSSANTLNIPRAAIKDAVVLTCLASHPPPGSFRPPYGGSAKPLHNVSQLRTWLLPQLDAPSNTPSLAEIENDFEGVWLDHTVKWKNRYLHPDDNMNSYSRNFASDFNTGSLMLMLDFTDAQKETLMIRLVQIGIDQFAILQSGGEWGADAGGIGSGRKWPILLAGILLDDPDMMDIGSDYGPITALEDCQTFYLTSSDTADYPGESVGDPVWGERHCDQPDTDPGNTSYRTCCTANAWVGAVLSVHILTGETDIDVKALWNHDPLFDYQDKYMDEREPGDWKRSWSAFQESMWDTYRADYGPVWVN